MKLKIKKLHPDARFPTYATDGSAAMDVKSTNPAFVNPGYVTKFGTGLAFEIPEGWCIKVYPRSGLAFKNGVRLCNSVAVIDSDYRGELVIGLTCDSQYGYHVEQGDRIAQIMLEPVERIELVESEDLTDTDRGSGGFGSTGNQ